MRRLSLLLLALAAGTGPAAAQSDEAFFRVGVGVRLNEFYAAARELTSAEETPGYSGGTFTLPVDVGALRLEPELGLARFADETMAEFGEDVSIRERTTATERTLGLAAFYRLRGSDASSALFGARVRHTRIALDLEYERTSPFGDERVEEDFAAGLLSVGPVIGGEYAFGPRFALGADLGLLYQRYSDDEFDDLEDDEDIDIDRDRSLINTETSVYVRFFF